MNKEYYEVVPQKITNADAARIMNDLKLLDEPYYMGLALYWSRRAIISMEKVRKAVLDPKKSNKKVREEIESLVMEMYTDKWREVQ